MSETNIVCLNEEEELLDLILSHSEYTLEYEVADQANIAYNWEAIEREVRAKYLSNRYKVCFNRTHLHYFTFGGSGSVIPKVMELQRRMVRMILRILSLSTSTNSTRTTTSFYCHWLLQNFIFFLQSFDLRLILCTCIIKI